MSESSRGDIRFRSLPATVSDAAGRVVEAADEVQECRLAGAGGTGYGGEFAPADGEIDAAEGLDLDAAPVIYFYQTAVWL